MTEGLLFVLAEPGEVPEDEFHDWYDNEHAPARLSVPGIRSGYRYRALDGERPGWLAWYELDIDALHGPQYQAIRNRSPREQSVVERLDTLDRRVYELIDDQGEPVRESPVVLSVALSTPDPAGLDTWYREEHLPLLLAIPGWHRIRRYRRVAGPGPDLLAFHEIDSVALFDAVEYRTATSTPWRAEVMGGVTARERRVFGFHNTVPGS
ncbi:hypothetical protein LWP59_06725 [Amycolatopsis acidiphila]|uniref:EthD family reductase n=1 Tax=Amycolatopsis acidiphila TaxID=715473 RepID=A0A558A9T4_9PSEU|nr:hypothetical protein [Amycolatopsis acidiphila]TVT21019.1 hypothetical protein FNH06_18510 [Amycolatopsis acidiphila]UIJ61318.1 hypothetical protein LWP59_06725 [Amycolatopsis acidiphila]GHG78242.1 hypothetical protein GCM10017788_45210 [Amycolatopsis acidiphila]